MADITPQSDVLDRLEALGGAILAELRTANAHLADTRATSIAGGGILTTRGAKGEELRFGRAGEEIAFLRQAGVPVRIVNGVSAAFAAAAALGLWNQNPISKYDVSPTSSQQMNRSSRLFAITRPSSAAANSAKKLKKRVKFSSCAM